MEKKQIKKIDNNNININSKPSNDDLYSSIFFCLGVVCIAVTIFLARFMAFDNDQFFLVATGRDIIKNGISHINNMTWLKGLEIVVQQWLYDVILYVFYDLFGKFSGTIISAVNLILLFIPLYKTTRLKNNVGKSFFVASVLILCSSNLICARPAILTAALLVWQLYVCEAKKSMWWIPIIVLLEANLHSSYIIFHFAYLMPYIVPGITKWLDDEHDLKYIKAIPAMIIAALCNPYGIKGTLYLFYAYTDVMNLRVAELRFFTLKNIRICIPIIILILVTIIIVTKYRKKIPSPTFYVYIGTIAILILSPVNKNVLFVTIGFLPILSHLFSDIISTKRYWLESAFAIIALIVVIVTTMPEKMANYQVSYPSETIKYLREVKPKRLFTCFDTGACLEFAGIKCFIDSRPELYLKKINNKHDYLYDEEKMVTGTNREKNALVNKYKFDYFFVDSACNYYFGEWAEDNCELIKVENDRYLYKYKSKD